MLLLLLLLAAVVLEYCNTTIAILSFVEIERLARWHSAQTRLMWLAFLDTAQRDLVEAQASSGKAPPHVTAQHALLEAQASSVKAPSFVRPSICRDEPMGNRDRKCPCCKPCFIGTAHLCDLPLGRYSGPIRYHVQKIAICTMVVPRLYQFSGVEVKSLAGKCSQYFPV